MRSASTSNWSWTVDRKAMSLADRCPSRALQDALVGWPGLPDDLLARMREGAPGTTGKEARDVQTGARPSI